jgi:hypothetical protein
LSGIITRPKALSFSSDGRDVKRPGSGFFIKAEDAIYLVSAGHVLEQGGWVIETDFIIEKECRVACIPIGGVWMFKKITTESSKLQEMDIAYAKVNLDAFQKSVAANKQLTGKSFEYMVYEGPLEDTPDPGMPHIYASANQGQLIAEVGNLFLRRDFSYEYAMQYKGKRPDGLYVFSIPEHKGHEYYGGASGSPIM